MMVAIVVVLNVGLALYGLQLTRQVWRLRRALAKASDTLIAAEHKTHAVLSGAPEAIRKQQLTAHQLRQKYQQLEPKFQQARQALIVLGLGRSLLPRIARSRKSAAKKLR